MNKKEQRALENRIRDVMEEPAELTSDEIAKIRERAYLGYQQKIENEKQPAREKRKKSGLVRRAVAVFAVAIGLIVMSVVYSVLAPVSVSNANNFVRRAAIWVNNQLHLGISFPVPEDENSTIKQNEASLFTSIETASKNMNTPLFYINNVDGLVIDSIETVNTTEDSMSVILHYKAENEEINITIEEINENSIIDVISEDYSTVNSSIGKVIIWNTNEIHRATAIYENYSIELLGTVPLELFINCCQSLCKFN